MHSKQSQVTLFLILGLVLLIAFGFIHSLYQNTPKEKIKGEIETSAKVPFSLYNIDSFLKICLQNLAQEGIDYISARGGYFTLPDGYYNNGIVNTAYYFYKDKGLVPKLDVIEKSISEYVKTYGDYCFQDLKNITSMEILDFKIENVTTRVLNKSLIVDLYAPTKIKSLSTIYDLNEFFIELNNNRLYDVYQFNNFLIEKQLDDKYTICLSCIINKGIEYKFFVDIANVGNNTLIFAVGYNDTKTNDIHKFIFANKYEQVNCQNLPIDAEEYLLRRLVEDCVRQEIEKYNYSLIVEGVDTLHAYVDVPFSAKIEAEGFDLEYKGYTDLFEIGPKTGIINFTPSAEQEGEHDALISVADKFGNEELKSIKINITSVKK